MARVDYEGAPEQEARVEAPDDLQHIETSPASFGAELAAGAESTGAGAIDAAKFYGTVAADNATNNFLDQKTKLLYGDPTQPVAVGPDGNPILAPDGSQTHNGGFFSLRGAEAVRAAPEVSQQLNEIMQENRQGLSTPQAQLEYETQTRRYRAAALQDISVHADNETKTYAKDTNDTSSLLALNTAARNPSNPDVIAEQQDNLNRAYVRNAQLKGESPQGALLKAEQDMTTVRLKSLMISDPAAAQALFDEKGDVLASLGNYDAIGRAVKEASINAQIGPATIQAINVAKATALSRVGNAGLGSGMLPDAATIKGAIIHQESGGNPNINPSVNGAVGIGQMKPETFAQFAKPGESINKPADNLAVAGRAIDAYSQKYDGDAARVAVAYFSGPGNVAPAGSTTPYIHDYKDGNGKSVSSYVADVQNLIGHGAPSATRYPSVADALRGTEDETLTQAQADAERMFPQYPDAQERYVTGVRRGLDQAITQQDQQVVINNHIVQAALASDHAPISEQELVASSPQVAAAWRSMQVDNPIGAMNIQRMFDANARGNAASYGKNVGPLLERVLGPSGAQDRITRASQLWENIVPTAGESSPLTNRGASILNDVIAMRGAPGGEANAAQLNAFFQTYHQQQTFSNETHGLRNEKGEERYNKSLLSMLPAALNGLKNGKTLSQLTDPKSSDYIGNLGVPLPSATEKMNEIITATENMPAPAQKAVLNPAKAAAVDRDIQGKHLTPQQGADLKGLMLDVQERRLTPQQARQRAIEKGIFPPDVPRPQ